MKTNRCLVLVLVIVLVRVTGAQKINPDIKSHPNWKLLDRGDDCGQSVPQFRIIGGTNATLGQYPWLVRLGYTKYTSKKRSVYYYCGGAIISDKYILTAAHCGPETMKLKLVSVSAGEYDRRTNPDCRNGVCAPRIQNIRVRSVCCHEGYGQVTYQNDICLLRLEKPIIFNDFVQPICLPVYNSFLSKDFSGEIMEVAGWGLTNIHNNNSFSKILHTLKVPVVPFDKCAEQYEGSIELIEKQMCAGGTVGKDSCAGDSGGPLMKAFSIKAPPRYFVVGIVSFGPTDCAETEVPGVYTKVAHYMTWILDNIKR